MKMIEEIILKLFYWPPPFSTFHIEKEIVKFDLIPFSTAFNCVKIGVKHTQIREGAIVPTTLRNSVARFFAVWDKRPRSFFSIWEIMPTRVLLWAMGHFYGQNLEPLLIMCDGLSTLPRAARKYYYSMNFKIMVELKIIDILVQVQANIFDR